MYIVIINQVKLKDYRNYTDESVTFAPGVNFLVGDNAQGKTNLLESIYFSAMGKSPKTNKEKNLIRFGSDYSSVTTHFVTNAGDKNIRISLLNNKKSVQINGVSISRLTELIGELNVVYFSPDELKLVKEVPEDRRKFLDISISQFDKDYLMNLIRYDKVLKQRNCILKSPVSEQSKMEQLALFTPQMIKLASKIIKKRIEFIKKLRIFASNIHKSLTGVENLSIDYSFNIDNIICKKCDTQSNAINKDFDSTCEKCNPHLTDEMQNKNLMCDNLSATSQHNDYDVRCSKCGCTIDDETLLTYLQGKLNNQFRTNVQKELILGYTACGPHRDDIIFKIDDNDCRYFASQGQQRTVALSLILANMEITKNETGEYPVLLLDDVMSELDDTRKSKLLYIVNHYQTIVTATEMPNVNIDTNVIKIKNGKVEK